MYYDKKLRYLDYLENGERIRNAGFVKIEVIDQLCNVQIQVTGLHFPENSTREVRLQGESLREGVLGTIAFQTGRGSLIRKRTPADDLGDGISYEDLISLRINLGKSRELVCRWKEGSGKRPEPRPETQPEARLEERLEPRPEVRPEEQPETQPEARPEERLEPRPEVRPEEQPEPRPEARPEAQPEPRPEVRPEAQPEARLEVRSEVPPEQPEPQPEERQEIQLKEQLQTQSYKELSEDMGFSETREYTGETESSDIRERFAGEEGQQNIFRREPQKGQADASPQQLSGPAMPPSLSEDKWKQLSDIYPHIAPFHDERDYLSIGPGDFVILPRKYYRLVTNSFLLHGFYNYGHLVLARTVKKGEEQFYLGVPGNFYERERQVAIMFGFESFECKTEPVQMGDYGYFMIRVEL